jgi:hypothetical protein
MKALYQKTRILSNNALKIIGMVSMIADHVGAMFFPSVVILRIVGRIAFPIFAFMIAEGARYTKNKIRYLSVLALFALVIQLVYSFYAKNARLTIFCTFTFSVTLIYSLQLIKKVVFAKKLNVLHLILAIILFVFLTISIYQVTKIRFVDYDFFGILTPVLVSLFHFEGEVKGFIKKLDNHLVSLLMLSIGLILIYFHFKQFQLYALLAIPILFFYSGKRGKLKMKYFFYLFYPLHLVLLEAIKYLI